MNTSVLKDTSALKDVSLLKEAIVKSFSQQAPTYAEHANVQAQSARMLAQFLNANTVSYTHLHRLH